MTSSCRAAAPHPTRRRRFPVSMNGLAVALVLAGGPAAALAQDAKPSAPLQLDPVRVEEDNLKSEGYRAPATTTGTKTDTELRNVPQSMVVVTREVIDDLDMQNMADVVRYVPGVSMGLGEGHRDAPTLRGNSSTADFFVDGVRDDVQYYRDLYNVERVEVLKGPNAMIFGRGGGGGVINRVMKRAEHETPRRLSLETGTRDRYRGEGDFSTGLGERATLRFNAMYENSDSHRRFFNLERFGLNPTVAFTPGEATRLDLSYEYYDDSRIVDRGIPSRNGRPFATGRSAFFGNPDLSYATTEVHLAAATVQHTFSPAVRLRNATMFGAYDKFYQNVFARNAVNAAGLFNLEAYQSATERQNLFNQTDVIWDFATGGIAHTLLTGAEIGRQWTDNLRNNSTFNPLVPAASPVSLAAVSFNVPNQNNDVDTSVVAFYIQDQVALLRNLDLIIGLRYDRFDIDLDNRLTVREFSRADGLWSPRAGLVFRPVEPLSLYASYSVSYLPSSGDQFAALDATSAALKPEKFENIEIGAKFEITPSLSATLALYRLDRDNTRAPGPAGTVVLTGSQRSQGIEVESSGQITDAWQVLLGYAYQSAKITATTAAAPAGRKVPLVPRHSFSLWNKVRVTPMWAAGVGFVHQGRTFASISNAVTLPSFARVDAGVFFTLNEQVEAQLNVENLLDEKYFASAHNDNNIMPGAPTSLRLGLKVRF